MRAIVLVCDSVYQRFPSPPARMSSGCAFAVGIGNSRTSPVTAPAPAGSTSKSTLASVAAALLPCAHRHSSRITSVLRPAVAAGWRVLGASGDPKPAQATGATRTARRPHRTTCCSASAPGHTEPTQRWPSELGDRLLDRGKDAVRLERLDHEVLRTGLDGLEDLGLLAERRAHDDAGLRVHRDDLLESREAVLLRHGDVEGHDLRLQGLELVNGLLAVGSLANHLMAALVEGVRNDFPHENGVVNDKYASHCNCLLGSGVSLQLQQLVGQWFPRRRRGTTARCGSSRFGRPSRCRPRAGA